MDWDPRFLSRSPMFEPLLAGSPQFGADWPRIEELQRLIDTGDAPVRNAGGLPLKLVVPVRRTGAPGERYEARVFLRGELEVRERSWHDVFNVLVWRVFPLAKAALNARHYEEQRARPVPGNRGPAQDALTLFDEGGVIVVSCDQELLEWLRAFRWKELFWHRRDEVRSRMRFILFGHAIYEKALAPFAGVTARAVLLPVPPQAGPDRLQVGLDSRVAAWIGDATVLSATRDLAPLPVLGVPGWCADNEQESYYDDADHFRPGRKGGP